MGNEDLSILKVILERQKSEFIQCFNQLSNEEIHSKLVDREVWLLKWLLENVAIPFKEFRIAAIIRDIITTREKA